VIVWSVSWVLTYKLGWKWNGDADSFVFFLLIGCFAFGILAAPILALANLYERASEQHKKTRPKPG
jgi:hypothetical protein